MYGKKPKDEFFSKINSTFTIVFIMFLELFRHPTIVLTPHLAHFMAKTRKKVFPKLPFLAHFGTLGDLCFRPHKSRLIWPKRMFFPGTFWPKPSLLGCLRSLKKNWVKTRSINFFSHFQILGDFAGFEAYYIRSHGASRPPKQAKKPNGGQKNVFWA